MKAHRRHWSSGPPRRPSPEDWEGHTQAEWDERRLYFIRRALAFFLMAGMSFVGLLAGLGLLIYFLVGGRSVAPGEMVILLVCLIPFLIVLVLSVAAGFRRFASPLAGMMAAVDAVAEGDLTVRVPERGRGNMARLAARFNRMTAELERAEQVRRNLTADVAHELRTPVHILQGNLEGVLDGVYEPTPEHMAAMLEETRLLARLVDDLQTLSLAEAGQLPLHPQTLAAADLLEDVATRFLPVAADQGVTIKVLPDDDAPAITVDPARMDQVISNLVANALRHTPSGGKVTLSAHRADEGVELSVADTGSGIDPADLPFIFDRFWRGDRSRAHGSGSAGLGLAITRRLVEAHGGTIAVDSEPGAGTIFTVWLPDGSPRDKSPHPIRPSQA